MPDHFDSNVNDANGANGPSDAIDPTGRKWLSGGTLFAISLSTLLAAYAG